MQTLLISVDGRVLRIAEDKVVRIGRSIDADIVLGSPSVSRAHAELRPTAGGWVLVDVGSAGGTFVGGARITERTVDGPVEVQCGPPGPGSTLTITPESLAPPELTGARKVVPMPPPAPPASGTAGPAASPQQRFAPPTGAPLPGAVPGGVGPGAMPPPAAPPAPGAMPPPVPPADSDMTIAPGSMRPVVAGMQPEASSGPDLMVIAEGREYRFRHPAAISVGRHSGSDVRITDESVSRHHAQITAVPGGWVFQNASQDGSYAEGRRIETEDFDETLKVRLGHPVAGEELTLVPILSAEEELRRFAAKRRRKALLVGGVAAVLVLGIGTAIAVPLALDGGNDPATGAGVDSMAELTDEEADAAKAASVWIAVPDPVQTDMIASFGSGSLLSAEGRILTNAHVADPGSIPEYAAEGISTPEFVYISLTDPEDDYRVQGLDYRARLVSSDGELDAAVVEIYADAEGNEVDPGTLDLPTLEIGDSDAVEQGDEVTTFGFPGIAWPTDMTGIEDLQNSQVTQTSGTIATIIHQDGDPRGVFDVTARIASGNSGGAAVDNDGRLIGVPTSGLSDQQSPVVSGRVGPVDHLAPVLEEAGIEVP